MISIYENYIKELYDINLINKNYMISIYENYMISINKIYMISI